MFQGSLYMISTMKPDWYLQHFVLFQSVFKLSDLLSIAASLLYIFRSIRTMKRRIKAMEAMDKEAHVEPWAVSPPEPQLDVMLSVKQEYTNRDANVMSNVHTIYEESMQSNSAIYGDGIVQSNTGIYGEAVWRHGEEAQQFNGTTIYEDPQHNEGTYFEEPLQSNSHGTSYYQEPGQSIHGTYYEDPLQSP